MTQWWMECKIAHAQRSSFHSENQSIGEIEAKRLSRNTDGGEVKITRRERSI